MRYFTLFLLLFTLCASDAQAQRRDDYQDSLDFLLDDGEMSEEEMEQEAMGVYNRCAADLNKSKYYNCECIGGAFLNQREKLGPYVLQFDILKKVYNEMPDCINETEIAGMAYQDCQRFSNYTRRNDDSNEDYCSCVARASVKNFALRPSLRAEVIEHVRAKAISECISKFPPEDFQ